MNGFEMFIFQRTPSFTYNAGFIIYFCHYGSYWHQVEGENPASIRLIQVNNRNTITMCEFRLKLTIKTLERHHYRRSGDFIINFV